MTEHVGQEDASLSQEGLERERISRDDIAYIVAFWNQDNPEAHPTAERGADIRLTSEFDLVRLRALLNSVTFLSDETRAEMYETAQREFEARRADDDVYIEDVNRWLKQHPGQVGVVTYATAHLVESVTNHDGWLAPCIFDGSIVPRQSIYRAQLRDEEA